MVLSTVVSWPPGQPAATSQGREARSAAQPETWREHPTRNWATGDIIEHVVRFHHGCLQQSLARLAVLMPQATEDAPHRAREWDKIGQRFEKLRDEVLRCVAHEERIIFPELLYLEQTTERGTPSTALQDEVQALEGRHARCLQFLWRLLRLAKDESIISPACVAGARVVEELSAFCDEFERCLFEEECLLFARVKPSRIGRPR